MSQRFYRDTVFRPDHHIITAVAQQGGAALRSSPKLSRGCQAKLLQLWRGTSVTGRRWPSSLSRGSVQKVLKENGRRTPGEEPVNHPGIGAPKPR
jgi:hypothetical protein